MNEWIDMSQRANMAHPGIPPPMTEMRMHQLKMDDRKQRESMGQKADMAFRRAYTDLTSKIAYLHPNPGLPRIRQGRIGGTWRHIREVLPHSGNRVIFVDGLVSVYDNNKFNSSLQAQLPSRPHLASARYAPVVSSRDLDSYHQRDLSTMQNAGYVPSVTRHLEMPRIQTAGVVSSTDPDVLRKLSLQSKQKFKGSYRYK